VRLLERSTWERKIYSGHAPDRSAWPPAATSWTRRSPPTTGGSWPSTPIHRIVTASVDAGATLAAGGTYQDLFYRPTVLTDVPLTRYLLDQPQEGLQATGLGMTFCPCRR
jgi:hypothetical protein